MERFRYMCIRINTHIMKSRKVFVLSFNQLSTDFWKFHLKLNHAQLWHSNNPEEGLAQISTVSPDVILVDGYWAKEAYDSHLNTILAKNSNADIFCLTPDEENEKLRAINGRFSVSRLSTDLLSNINALINVSTKVDERLINKQA